MDVHQSDDRGGRALGELVAEARCEHRPVIISEHGKPVVALINLEDLADLEDRAALAAHFADKNTCVAGVVLDELDAALDRIDAETGAQETGEGSVVSDVKEELHRKLQASRAALLSKVENLSEYDRRRPGAARPPEPRVEPERRG